MGGARVTLRKQVILGKDSPAIKDKKVAVCQSLSGTGALRIAAEFLAQYNPGVQVYCSDPTWGNHHAIFAKAGLKTFKYRYLNQVKPPRLLGAAHARLAAMRHAAAALQLHAVLR